MAKKSTKKTLTKSSVKERVKAAGYILPHGYKVQKMKRKSAKKK